MAWIVKLPPSPRHPQSRWQVRYRRGITQRSAGIYPSKSEALQVKRALERGDHIASSDQSHHQPSAAATATGPLLGDYIAEIWWPTWKPGHPRSARGTRSKLNHRILPALGSLPLDHLNRSVIAAWQRAMTHEGLAPNTISTYLSLLGTICNAAVDDGYLSHSPLTTNSARRRRHPSLAQLPPGNPRVRPQVAWLSRPQLDQLANAIDPAFRTLILVAALTGARWSELTALHWEDVRADIPHDDGAVNGPGRLRVLSRSSGRKAPDTDRQAQRRSRPQPDRRLIALDQEALGLLQQHRTFVEGRNRELVFTTPSGERGRGRPLAATSFARIWHQTLNAIGLDQTEPWQARGGLHFSDLRHTHAVWLLARQIPIAAVAARLGHTTPITTMRMYQHPARLIQEGQLTAERLGLSVLPLHGGPTD